MGDSSWKVQPLIMDDMVRVNGKKIDDRRPSSPSARSRISTCPA